MSGGRDTGQGGHSVGLERSEAVLGAAAAPARGTARVEKVSIGRARCSRALRPRLGWAWRQAVRSRLRPARVRGAAAHRIHIVERSRPSRARRRSRATRDSGRPIARVGAASGPPRRVHRSRASAAGRRWRSYCRKPKGRCSKGNATRHASTGLGPWGLLSPKAPKRADARFRITVATPPSNCVLCTTLQKALTTHCYHGSSRIQHSSCTCDGSSTAGRGAGSMLYSRVSYRCV